MPRARSLLQENDGIDNIVWCRFGGSISNEFWHTRVADENTRDRKERVVYVCPSLACTTNVSAAEPPCGGQSARRRADRIRYFAIRIGVVCIGIQLVRAVTRRACRSLNPTSYVTIVRVRLGCL